MAVENQRILNPAGVRVNQNKDLDPGLNPEGSDSRIRTESSEKRVSAGNWAR